MKKAGIGGGKTVGRKICMILVGQLLEKTEIIGEKMLGRWIVKISDRKIEWNKLEYSKKKIQVGKLVKKILVRKWIKIIWVVDDEILNRKMVEKMEKLGKKFLVEERWLNVPSRKIVFENFIINKKILSQESVLKILVGK